MIFFTVVIVGEQAVLRFAERVGLLYASINSTEQEYKVISITTIHHFQRMEVGFVKPRPPNCDFKKVSPFIQPHRLKTFSVLLWINSHQPCGKRKSVSLTVTHKQIDFLFILWRKHEFAHVKLSDRNVLGRKMVGGGKVDAQVDAL